MIPPLHVRKFLLRALIGGQWQDVYAADYATAEIWHLMTPACRARYVLRCLEDGSLRQEDLEQKNEARSA